MRLAVTGATGYIGSHFVKVAAKSGHQITATDYNMKQNDIQKYCMKVLPWDITSRQHESITVDKVIHISQDKSSGISQRPMVIFSNKCQWY